jgi:hypothetical protein
MCCRRYVVCALMWRSLLLSVTSVLPARVCRIRSAVPHCDNTATGAAGSRDDRHGACVGSVGRKYVSTRVSPASPACSLCVLRTSRHCSACQCARRCPLCVCFVVSNVVEVCCGWVLSPQDPCAHYRLCTTAQVKYQPGLTPASWHGRKGSSTHHTHLAFRTSSCLTRASPGVLPRGSACRRHNRRADDSIPGAR